MNQNTLMWKHHSTDSTEFLRGNINCQKYSKITEKEGQKAKHKKWKVAAATQTKVRK